eukprot:scaffold11862_cov21-Tisochrysis_lutea.AAC.5
MQTHTKLAACMKRREQSCWFEEFAVDTVLMLCCAQQELDSRKITHWCSKKISDKDMVSSCLPPSHSIQVCTCCPYALNDMAPSTSICIWFAFPAFGGSLRWSALCLASDYPWTRLNLSISSRAVDYWWSHALIGDDVLAGINENCDFSRVGEHNAGMPNVKHTRHKYDKCSPGTKCDVYL